MTRTDAFLLLQVFRRRALPTLLRKLNLWKGLDGDRHADLLEDLHQELWLDCLENPDLILALDSRSRHTRWFRLVQKKHYEIHTRGERRRTRDAVLDSLPQDATTPCADFDPVAAWGTELPARQQRFLRKLSSSARYLKNGRLNCRASARSLGMRPQDLTSVWDQVAETLGFGTEYLDFWRRRLVEALVGLAADLLRDQRAVTVHDEARRRRPDPRGRLRRIRFLRDQINRRPMPPDVKRVLSRYARASYAEHLDPRRILDDAARLGPNAAAVHLWRFEAHVAVGDLPSAATAIRAARRSGAAAIPVLLARARLLEHRGREVAARRLLGRSSAAARDRRVASALDRLAG